MKRKTKRPPLKMIRWTDDDLDNLAEIHSAEDTPLMLAFVRRYGTPRLLAMLTAAREEPPEDTPPNG